MSATAKKYTASPAGASRARDWFRLLRAPNLLTVPGDGAAGYLLATGAAAQPDGRLLAVLGASVLFYVAGLLMNDLADRETDRRERPNRPIPSGRVSASTVRNVLLMCLLVGLALSASAGRWVLIVALLLVGSITAYNLLPRAGPLAVVWMATCRGLNVLLGAAVASAATTLVWTGAMIVAWFVAALTILARHEMSEARPGWRVWMPAAVILVGFIAILRLVALPPDMEMRLAGAFFFAFALAGLAGWRVLEGGRAMAPSAVGLLISALIPLQAALCLAAGAGAWGMGSAFLLILFWPLNRLLARSFAPS